MALCTDDRNPLDIAEHGHLDYMIRHAISKGVEPLADLPRRLDCPPPCAFGLARPRPGGAGLARRYGGARQP
jgi:adenine deaminase